MAYTTINKSSDYFNTKLYTGNGSAGNAQTGVGFQPDWVWIKNRDVAYWNQAFDAVRGTSSGALYTNQTSAEDYGGGNLLASFDSDGFTVNSNDGCNGNGEDLVAWNWLAANGTASNTDGSITSTVSVNTTSGFSIVSFVGNATSGATVGHGLNAVPKVVIIKGRDSALEWRSYFSPIGAGKYMVLNENYAEATGSNFMNDTAPTSSVFSLGNGTTPNKNGENYIAYCFAEKTGYSKFGSYVGNGNADGPFIYTGFKPAWVMAKKSNSTGNWVIVDTKRDGYNGANDTLQANVPDVESGGNRFDIVSNGFKARSTSSYSNTSGDTFIYMAFAEEPLVGDNPATAR